jgi:glyoxylase-like metal-dependent hydrolase (beta-lactamase superfamily II)
MWCRILHDEASGELAYLLADTAAREAVVIDPRRQDVPVLQALLGEWGLRLRWVLRTHDHDARQPDTPARLHELGAPLVQGRPTAHTRCPADAETLTFGDEFVRVLHTPGHTAHCLSFAWRDRVFCGGLLAVHACPHQPLPAQPEALWDSVTQRIFTLPDETLLFAGHARRARAVSTVLEQRRWHPLFGGATRDAFLARMAARSAAATRAPVSAAVLHGS